MQSHEALVVRIDSNAEEALYDIEGAKNELRELYETTSSNRQLMLKIFFILVVFITFYILFVLWPKSYARSEHINNKTH